MDTQSRRSRRGFIAACAGAVAAALGANRHAFARTPAVAGPHPEPRPGIDGSKVLRPEDLADDPELIPLYDGIRRIPHIADGIRCACGCANASEYRSLLVCYEDSHMAMHCEICQTEGRMAVRLHEAGRTLDQIRAAIDARFG